jgi:hypothetical protein
MARLLPLALLLLIPIMLSACGGGKPATVAQQIPAAGATVSLGKDVTLQIPAGAVADATRVTITKKNAPGDALAGGQSLGFGFNIDLGGQKLQKPVTLEIAYDPKKLPKGSTDTEAFVAYYDEQRGAWVPAGGTVDPQRHVITIQADHLSWWNPFSWNWEAWIAVLHDALTGKLSNWVNGLQVLTESCNRSGQSVTIDESKANHILQGCVTTDDAASPKLRVANLKSFYIGISPAPGGPGYPAAQVLGPGESAAFTASTGDKPPATVYADFTEPAMWRFVVSLCAEMLPGGDLIPNDGLQFIADGLSRVMSAKDASDALDRNDATAAAEAVYEIITGDGFIETFAQLAKQYGQQHRIDMLTKWTQAGIHTALLGLASADAFLSSFDFLSNYVYDNHSEVAFSWSNRPTSAATATTAPPAQPPDDSSLLLQIDVDERPYLRVALDFLHAWERSDFATVAQLADPSKAPFCSNSIGCHTASELRGMSASDQCDFFGFACASNDLSNVRLNQYTLGCSDPSPAAAANGYGRYCSFTFDFAEKRAGESQFRNVQLCNVVQTKGSTLLIVLEQKNSGSYCDWRSFESFAPIVVCTISYDSPQSTFAIISTTSDDLKQSILMSLRQHQAAVDGSSAIVNILPQADSLAIVIQGTAGVVQELSSLLPNCTSATN